MDILVLCCNGIFNENYVVVEGTGIKNCRADTVWGLDSCNKDRVDPKGPEHQVDSVCMNALILVFLMTYSPSHGSTP